MAKFFKVTLMGDDGEKEDLVRCEESADAAREWGETLDERGVVAVHDFTKRVEAAGQRALSAILSLAEEKPEGSEGRLAMDFIWDQVREQILDLG